MSLLPRPQLDAALLTLPRVSVHGRWTRTVEFKHLTGSAPQPLYAKGAPAVGARYTPVGGADSIYLSSDPFTALIEVQAVFLHKHAPPFTIKTPPWVLFAVDGVVTEVVDLCDASVQATLGTSFQELTGDWATPQANFLARLGALPPTQVLGQAAHDSGVIHGLCFPSAKNPGGGVNVVVFKDRLVAGGPDWLEVQQPLKARLP